MKINFDKDPLLEMNSPVVTHNIEMMDEDMQDAWSDEPAESIVIKDKTYDASILSGYADRESGEILAFIAKNKHVSQEIKVRGIRFTFIAGNYFDIKKRQEVREILDFPDADDFSALGRKHMKEAIKAYNDSH